MTTRMGVFNRICIEALLVMTSGCQGNRPYSHRGIRELTAEQLLYALDLPLHETQDVNCLNSVKFLLGSKLWTPCM